MQEVGERTVRRHLAGGGGGGEGHGASESTYGLTGVERQPQVVARKTSPTRTARVHRTDSDGGAWGERGRTDGPRRRSPACRWTLGYQVDGGSVFVYPRIFSMVNSRIKCILVGNIGRKEKVLRTLTVISIPKLKF